MELTRAAAVLLVASLCGTPAAAAGPDAAEAREAAALLMEFAAIPSHSDNAPGVERAAGWLQGRFESLGFKVRALDGAPRSNPLLLAERRPPGAQPAATVLFYMHYDTQPTGPARDWAATGGKPFVPRLLSGRWNEPGVVILDPSALDAATIGGARLYARGAADDKAPIVMHLRALSRWVKTPGAARLHLKYVLDGEEEAGSPHIAGALDKNRDALAADLLILCDGPMDAAGRPSVFLGTRGDMHMKLKVRTADLPAHSGNYGLLPGAAWKLASLLASMKDARGNVTIEGFMDDVIPPTADQRLAMAQASREAEPIIAAALGADRFDGDPGVSYFERLLFRPGLNINVMGSGRPGNQIPVEAEAILEVRLVARQDPRKVHETVRRHVQERMPEATLEYLDGSPAGRMSPDDPAVAAGLAAIRDAAGGNLIVYPTLGGTLPLLADFEKAGHKYIGLPLVNFDNNQHVGNENVRIEALAEGVALVERLLERLSSP